MNVIAQLQLVSLLLVLGLAVFWDLKERRIPNSVTVPGLVVGLLLAGLAERALPGAALGGALLALVLSFPVFALGWLGAGDCKLLTAVGAYVGVGGLLSVFVFGGIAGGILAVGNVIRRGAILNTLVSTRNLLFYQMTLGRHGEQVQLGTEDGHEVPYGLAIAAGTLATWFFPLSLGVSP